MKYAPIANDISFTDIPQEITHNNSERWKNVKASLLVSLLTFALLFLFVGLDSPMIVRFNGALLITLFILVPSVYLSLRDKQTNSALTAFATSGNNRFGITLLSPLELNENSIIRQMMLLYPIDDTATTSPLISQANGVVRRDRKKPDFFAGIMSFSHAYRNNLMLSVDLGKTFPHIFVDCDDKTSKHLTTYDDKLKNDQKYHLEGEFADRFTLYANSADSARAATYVFTPDVMEAILKLSPRADIEIVGSRLYIIWQPRTKEVLWGTAFPELFTVLNGVASELAGRVAQYIPPASETATEKIIFNAPAQTQHAVIKALDYIPGDTGFVIRLLRQKGFWLTLLAVFGILFIIIVIEIYLTSPWLFS